MSKVEAGFRSIEELKITREIRDPIYGYIHITKFENDIIDTRIFQRLERILQMPTAHMAYPSGKYSRKTHSLGVMHLVHKAMLHIFYLHSPGIQKRISPLLFGRSVVIKEEKDKHVDKLDQNIGSDWWDQKDLESIIQYARIAALLHDVGHAPFSHTFEEVSSSLFNEGHVTKKFNHEEAGIEIIEGNWKKPKKWKELGIKDPFIPGEIVELLKKEGNSPPFMRELISGPFDCDKLDYMMRDAYHLGTPEYGNIDCERIIDGIRIKESKLCISSSSIHALMNSFRAIQSMYTAIYYHRTARIFDFMIQDALSLVPDLVEEISTSVDKLVEYDDSTIICEIRRRSREKRENRHKYKEASQIFQDIYERKKRYKCVLEHPANFPIEMIKDAKEQLKEVESIVNSELDFGNLKIRVDFKPTIRPIGLDLDEIQRWLRSHEIYTEDGELKPLKDVSGAYSKELSRYTVILRVFVGREGYDQCINTIKIRIKNVRDEVESRLSQL